MSANGSLSWRRAFHWHDSFDLENLAFQGPLFYFFFSLAILVCFASVFSIELNILYQWIKKHTSLISKGISEFILEPNISDDGWRTQI